jgi:predicted permease
LLVGAGLFVRTLNNLRNTNLGFDRNNLLLFGLDPSLSGYHRQKLRALLDQITGQLQLVPGVRSVAFAHVTPISHSMSGGDVGGDLPGHANDEAEAMYNVVGTDYFRTMRMKLLAGRNFGPQDTLTSTPVAVISKRLANKLFGKESPIGHTLHKDVHVAMYKRDYQIIGVVADAKYADVKRDFATYFLPYAQAQEVLLRGPSFVVRTGNDPHAVVADVRRAVAKVDPQLPIRDLRTQVEQIDLSLSQEILFADLTSTFGALALALACVGLYGTMAYSVSRRTREIGIRVALGADRQSLRAMVLREGLLVVSIGVAIGIPVAIGLSRLVSSLLWGVHPIDAKSLIAAPLLMILVAVIAIAVPTHRATRVDPMLALRCE